MWKRLTITLALAAAAGVFVSITRSYDSSPVIVVEPPVSDAEAKLDQRITPIDLDDTLDGCVDKLREASGANFVVRSAALKAAKYPADIRVRLRLHDVTLAQALFHLLKEAGTDEARLGYDVCEGAIVISSAEDLSRQSIVRVYDVHDLILAAMKPPPDGPGHGWGDTAEYIEKILTDTVAPDSWREAGGSVGSIKELNGRLIVAQSSVNHREIARLLDELRHPTGGKIKLPATRPSHPASQP